MNISIEMLEKTRQLNDDDDSDDGDDGAGNDDEAIVNGNNSVPMNEIIFFKQPHLMSKC
jgi:hypothetical protein